MKKLVYLLIIAAIFTACDTDTAKESPEETTEMVENEDVEVAVERSTTGNPLYNDMMLPSVKGGIFRGISFDMSREKALAMETSRSTVTVYQDENDDEFTITSDMGKEILDFGDVTYSFDEQGMYSVKVETYITSLEKSTEVVDMMIAHYTEMFGEPTVAEDGYSEFEAYDEASGYDYSIAIKNIDDVEESFGFFMYIDLL